MLDPMCQWVITPCILVRELARGDDEHLLTSRISLSSSGKAMFLFAHNLAKLMRKIYFQCTSLVLDIVNVEGQNFLGVLLQLMSQ